ncbi:hypothetical protein J1N35_011576 [Gossypium stocksii]|uniref:Uncharacterized protein n=1 Tax=Gossypium stocksii TaxID=47602 RepID=A0A9D3W4H1_9ROSI|nr:hypothetical protein J1N35_011576 [Gossypium stocksii]
MANENNGLLSKLNFSNKEVLSVQVGEDDELIHTRFEAKVLQSCSLIVAIRRRYSFRSFDRCVILKNRYNSFLYLVILLLLNLARLRTKPRSLRDNEGWWTKYIRVRVVVDVFKPLHQMVKLWGPTRAEQLCLVKYECLLKFCPECGLIINVIDACMVAEVSLESMVSNLQYRDWLRVQVLRKGGQDGVCHHRCGIKIVERPPSGSDNSHPSRRPIDYA